MKEHVRRAWNFVSNQSAFAIIAFGYVAASTTSAGCQSHRNRSAHAQSRGLFYAEGCRISPRPSALDERPRHGNRTVRPIPPRGGPTSPTIAFRRCARGFNRAAGQRHRHVVGGARQPRSLLGDEQHASRAKREWFVSLRNARRTVKAQLCGWRNQGSRRVIVVTRSIDRSNDKMVPTPVASAWATR